jgi:hypothetical protein
VAFLAHKEKVDVSVVEEWLNKKSGLLGVSGQPQDTRVLVPTLRKMNARNLHSTFSPTEHGNTSARIWPQPEERRPSYSGAGLART